MAEVYGEENTEIEITEIRGRTEGNSDCWTVPQLPNNKDYHMFVCYIQEDAEDVRIIVDNLEQNGVKCCYHERDFLPGQQVIGNIHESINRSMSILIVLSENFVQSRFCKHEIEQALHAKIEEDYTIIPIKIQRCEIPNVLKNYTRIDAEYVNPVDMHKKVIDAFVSNVWHSRQMVESNGFMIECLLTKYTISWRWLRWLSLYRYKMIFDAASLRRISRNGFEISEDTLNETEQIVNNSDYIKYAHITNKFGRMTSFVFFMAGFLHISMTIIIFICLIKPTVNTQTEYFSKVFWYGLLAIFILWLLVLMVHGCGALGNFKGCKGMTRSLIQRTKAQLTRKLWIRINKKTVDSRNCIIIFAAMKLHVMRFDRQPCRNFFIRRCSLNENLKIEKLPAETLQEYADRLFDNYMEENSEMLLVESLTPGRHTMKNGAKCLCQLVQDKLLQEDI